MNENFDLSNLGNDDAIAFDNAMLKSLRLKEAIKYVFESKAEDLIDEYLKSQNIAINRYYYDSRHGSHKFKYSWHNKGVKCEVLKLGAHNWQKGRIQVRVSVEFIPDEPEELDSPLDDIRQSINENQ